MKRTSVDGLTARRLGLAPDFDRRALDAARMARLRHTVRHVQTSSPWYREHLAGIDPESLQTLDDLAGLPLMSATDVARHGERMVCVSQSEVARIITLQTSGSTGRPKRLHFTRDDLDGTVDFFLQGMLSLVAQQDRVLALLPYEQPDSTGQLLLSALRGGDIDCDGCWPPLSPADLARHIVETGTTCVVGLPQHLLALSEELPLCQVRTMLLCSDYAAPALRTRIEMACGCETFLHYGTTETGLGGGVECAAHDGCHLRESDLLVEIVHAQTGKPVPEGVEGDVVISTLSRRGMPLVRYRTGDTASLDTSPCRCGGLTARLCGVLGRSLPCRVSSGNLSSQELDDRLFSIEGLLDYRATVERIGAQDSLRIEFLARPGHDGLTGRLTAALERIPVVAAGLASGTFRFGPMQQVDAFSPSHTIKRTIADLRSVR